MISFYDYTFGMNFSLVLPQEGPVRKVFSATFSITGVSLVGFLVRFQLAWQQKLLITTFMITPDSKENVKKMK